MFAVWLPVDEMLDVPRARSLLTEIEEAVEVILPSETVPVVDMLFAPASSGQDTTTLALAFGEIVLH